MINEKSANILIIDSNYLEYWVDWLSFIGAYFSMALVIQAM